MQKWIKAVGKDLKRVAAMTWGARATVASLIVLFCGATWLVSSIFYEGRIETKNSTIENKESTIQSLETELEGYRALMPGKSVEEIAEQFKQLKKQVAEKTKGPELRNISEWGTENPNGTYTHSIRFEVDALVRPASATLKIAAEGVFDVELENYTGFLDMRKVKSEQGVDVMYVNIYTLQNEHIVRIKTSKPTPITWGCEF